MYTHIEVHHFSCVILPYFAMLFVIYLRITPCTLFLMLALVIAGYSLGENISWLLGLPVMAIGLLCFQFGGKNQQPGASNKKVCFLLGLGCMIVLLLGGVTA